MKFFGRFKTQEGDPTGATWGNITSFYGLLIFLTTIPFVLIVALVWLTGILGFSAWIFAGFAVLMAVAVYRAWRGWGRFKKQMAAQGGEFQDMVREATRSGKDVEISLLNGVLTLRYKGQNGWPGALPAGQPELLALEGPATIPAEVADSGLAPERLREELEEFLRLKDEGVITPEEFDRIKTGLLQRM